MGLGCSRQEKCYMRNHFTPVLPSCYSKVQLRGKGLVLHKQIRYNSIKVLFPIMEHFCKSKRDGEGLKK